MEAIRHPIIERLHTETEYITNNVELGCNEQTGMLFYGLNGSGKSSYMKSIGLNVILAQIGMFVAADTFEYHPFHNLFTRITGEDNLFKGHSSFVVEMTELRAIIEYSDKFSLVLGDEITKGTEYISGTAIMASSILNLSERSTNFVFATHLHNLSEISNIKDLSNVKSYHLTVDYTSDDEIIYNRKLLSGHGDSLYGIEVMKHIINNKQFTETAFDIRNKIIKKKDLLETNKSVYNSQVYIDCCEICMTKDNLHTHHIKFQCTADTSGFIGNIHKNKRHNLVVLCEEHHTKVHAGDIVINGWKSSLNGKKLEYTCVEKRKCRKFGQTEIDIVNGLNNMTQKKAKKKLKDNHNIEMSVNIISKIWKNVY